MFTGLEIRKKRKNLKLSAQELAEQIGVSKDNLYKWEKGHKPTDPEDFIKVQNWLNGKVENVPHETQKDHPFKKDDLSLEVILKLTNSNQTLSDANKKLADAHYLLAEGNRELVRMVEGKVTANAPEQNQPELTAIRKVVLEFLFQVGSGKRWKNPDEAGRAYNKRVAELLGLEKPVDIRNSLDKQHI